MKTHIAGPRSRALFRAAARVIPGGVNSPVRSFSSVGGEPLFIEKGKGSKIFDADQKEYIDYVMSWGPLIFGHAHPEILGKIAKVLDRGTSFGAPTGFELELARLVCDAFPSIDITEMRSAMPSFENESTAAPNMLGTASSAVTPLRSISRVVFTMMVPTRARYLL